MKPRVYFPNLDGLRFFCFLMVFFYHSFHTNFVELKTTALYAFVKQDLFGNGNLGVNFFFVLSGFLITYLLIVEKETTQKIHLKYFWIRRILRIWPLFYACVLFGFYGFPLLKQAFGQTANETASIGYYLTFLNNFDIIQKGLPDASVLGVLWSVAIEEQFYLVWPVLLSLTSVRRYGLLFGWVIVVSLVFRAKNDTYLFHEFHTLSCMSDMAVGALGAWLSLKPNFRDKLASLSKVQVGGIYLALFVVFFFRDELFMSHYVPRVLERLLISFVLLAVILEQNFAKASLFKLQQFKTLSYLGTLTYGMYCLHFIGILVTTTLTNKLGWNKQLWQVLLLETGVALVLTIGLSILSYRILESPFLKLKSRFAFITQ